MKFSCLLTCALLLFGAAKAQEKIVYDANAELRKVGSFHAIRVSSGIRLIMKQGDEEAVAVSAANREWRDAIRTEVVNGVLKIYFDNHWYDNWKWSENRKLKAYVSFRQIDQLHGSSGSSTQVEGTLKGNDLTLELSSGAGFEGEVDAAKLRIEGSSGATARVSGKAQTASVEASSGASVKAYELESETCDADASSGGQVQISVTKQLVADASSGGDVRYKGSGIITKVSTGGGGSVKKQGD